MIELLIVLGLALVIGFCVMGILVMIADCIWDFIP